MKIERNIGYFTPPVIFAPLSFFDRCIVKRGRSFIDLSESSLINAALKSTGLSDWGEENFYPALHSLLHSCREEANLNLLGKYLCRIKMVELLKNRLCIQNEFNLNREIAEEKILKPLVIASLPRSGTTLLHNLLSLDGSMRYLKGWESIYPSLHPKYAKKGTDPRIRLHKNEIKLIETFVPQASRVHPMSAEGPEECHLLLAHTFSWSLSFEVLFNIPSHVKWVTVQDMVPVYRYYKKILQLLQWHYSPGPWVLKSPDHLGNLDALLEVFPDANIVFINRDPLDVMPSFCNLIAIGRSVHSDKVDLQEIGREYTERFNRWIESSHNVRSLHHPQHFYDLQYEVFVKDPVRAVRGIYDYFGYDYNPGMDKRIPEWLTGKAWSSNKTHNCTLEDFGLNKKLIKEKFEHFN